MANNKIKRILFVSASVQHAILDNRLMEELGKKDIPAVMLLYQKRLIIGSIKKHRNAFT